MPDALPDRGAVAPSRESLSALADGHADADEVSRLLDRWAAEADLPATWHAYQVLGDVMRSEELAGSSAGDAAFLAGVRERLRAEPPIVAPLPMPSVAVRAGSQRLRRWSGPAAVAAGFSVVAGVMVVMRPGAAPGPLSASATRAGATAPVLADASREKIIRDARLDRYLDAHRQFAPVGALGGPGGAVRSVDWVPQRP